MPPAERTALNWYTVRRGESLQTIARKLRVSRTDLAQANYLGRRRRCRPGQRLVIPRPPATLMAARPDRPVPVAESRRVAGGSRPGGEAPSAAQSKDARLIYEVKRATRCRRSPAVFRTTVASLRVVESPGQHPRERRRPPDDLHAPASRAARLTEASGSGARHEAGRSRLASRAFPGRSPPVRDARAFGPAMRNSCVTAADAGHWQIRRGRS